MNYLKNAKPRIGPKREASDGNVAGPSDIKRRYKGKCPSLDSMLVPNVQHPGEDKSSHDRHVKLMQLEERKVSPNTNILNDLMKRTFSLRRTEIVDKPQPIQQILSYPSLRRYNQV